MNFVWPIVLQFLAFAVLFAEVLIPSFGVLTLVALALGIWSWYFVVTEFSVAGIIAFALADAILVPLAVRQMFRYLGRSPVSHVTDVGTGSGLEEATHALEVHLGAVVEADTALRPAGKIRVGDDVYEARTAGEFVEKGARVRINAVRGAEFLVEKI
jgi:membrane-bound ClpP family serine protease